MNVTAKAQQTARLKKAKQALRARFKAEREALMSGEKTRAADLAMKALTQLQVYQGAKTLALYAADTQELATRPLFDYARAQGRIVAFPRVSGSTLTFHPITAWEELREGFGGILEPIWGKELAPGDIDLCFVPGIAFDAFGGRLGRGGGYYDRLLAGPDRPACAVGWAYAFQIVSAVPMDKHDQRVDMVVTDQGVLKP